MAAIGHDDHVGQLPVAGVFARVDHRMHLAERAEAGGGGEVHRGGAHQLGIAPLPSTAMTRASGGQGWIVSGRGAERSAGLMEIGVVVSAAAVG